MKEQPSNRTVLANSICHHPAPPPPIPHLFIASYSPAAITSSPSPSHHFTYSAPSLPRPHADLHHLSQQLLVDEMFVQ